MPTQLTKPDFVKVRDLERLRSGYNVYVKVLTVEKKVVDARDGSKIQMANAVVGDETAVANSFFKGHRAALVEVGNVLAIRNGTKKYIKDFISLELDAFGRLTLEKEVAVESSLQNFNISKVEHKKPNYRLEDRRDYRGRGWRRDWEGDRGRERDDRGRGRDERWYRDNRDERYRDNRGYGYRDDRRRQERYGYNYRTGSNRQDARRDYRGPQDRGDRRPDRSEGNNAFNDYSRNYNDNSSRPAQSRDYDRLRQNQYSHVDRKQEAFYPPVYNRPYDQEYNRGRQQDYQREVNFLKISQIQPGDEYLNFAAKIVSMRPSTSDKKAVICVLGDETGVVNAYFPFSVFLQVGKIISLFNVDALVVEEHIQVTLNSHSRLQVAKNFIARVNDLVNISAKAWVPQGQ